MCGNPADVVDHITPHRGDEALFWNWSNWQALCAPCHNRHKQRAENLTRRKQSHASVDARSHTLQTKSL
ncbi:HNH endonuclease [Paracoccus sanguinis]|uniref:HNH endonuclease signature motif containing protein n=1 Tax=Paracoccus sanguinis TaxID=1545044 RepID=UPI001E4F131D|nr:HNH endonuclease [Paracoccus sanguinis]